MQIFHKIPIFVTLALLLTLLTACAPSGNLQPNDFNLYLDRKKAVEVKANETFTVSESDDEPFETKRGVGAGSTKQDVAEAYKNIETGVWGFDNNGNAVTSLSSELNDFILQHPDMNEFTASYVLRLVNGKPESDFEKVEASARDEKNEIITYSLFFRFKNGLVENFTIMIESP